MFDGDTIVCNLYQISDAFISSNMAFSGFMNRKWLSNDTDLIFSQKFFENALKLAPESTELKTLLLCTYMGTKIESLATCATVLHVRPALMSRDRDLPWLSLSNFLSQSISVTGCRSAACSVSPSLGVVVVLDEPLDEATASVVVTIVACQCFHWAKVE